MILDNIFNHYETLVFDEVMRQQAASGHHYEAHLLEDVVCVALNNLPARYVRHRVDIAFYLTQIEREKMHEQVNEAVRDAFVLVTSNPHTD